MKIACLLGVSDYSNGANLPACAHDVELMEALLKATGEYDKLLSLSSKQTSPEIKQQIISFLTQFKGKPVDQLLFYYTGHGDFDGKDFSYLLGDFDPNRRKQTVIENTELDNWLRMLSPGLTVKIVDACHAGVQYIKDPDVFERFLDSAPKAFKTCYFLYSSQKDEFSYQDQELSDFTRSIAESVRSFDGTEMRFQDVADYVTDAFRNHPQQTPFFVSQATQTEVFTSVNESLRSTVASELVRWAGTTNTTTTTTTTTPAPPAKTPSLVEQVKKDAHNYCTKDEVIERLSAVNKRLESHTHHGDLAKLYTFEVTPLTSVDSEVPRLEAIGKWLAENSNEYFAEPTYRTQQYEEEIEVPKKRRDPFSSILGSHFFPEYETRTVTRERQVVNGYALTEHVEASVVRLTARPQHENLKWHDCHVAFVFSKTEMRLFFLFSTFKEVNWQDRTRCPAEKWRMIVVPMKDHSAVEQAVSRIGTEFDNYVLAPILAKYSTEKTSKP